MSSTIQGISAIQKPVETAEKIVQKTKDAASSTVTAKSPGEQNTTLDPKSTSRVAAASKVKETNKAAVYEKTKQTDSKKEPYKINKMSKEDRAALVKALKEEVEARQKKFLDLVTQTISGQGQKISIADGNMDDIWKKLAKGDFKISEAAKKQAKEEISEKGYWGVEQTSKRLFDYASALAGDDVDKMKAMQAAMENGYKEATKAWGKELPEISKKTLAAANKLFDDFYKSKGVTNEQAMAAQASSELTNQATIQNTATANTAYSQPDQAIKGIQSISKG
ncbi:MAG: hypothetical protein ACFNTU_07015 [Catonella sp.]